MHGGTLTPFTEVSCAVLLAIPYRWWEMTAIAHGQNLEAQGNFLPI